MLSRALLLVLPQMVSLFGLTRLFFKVLVLVFQAIFSNLRLLCRLLLLFGLTHLLFKVLDLVFQFLFSDLRLLCQLLLVQHFHQGLLHQLLLAQHLLHQLFLAQRLSLLFTL